MAPTSGNIFLHDHPVSSYAQKVRIALREKGLPFDFATPQGLGSGQQLPELRAANLRLEVPALIDGDLKIFDSTIILQYLEDAYPEPKLLPASPADRARARMIEDVCDTTYEAINWGYGEISWFGRAPGELNEKLRQQVQVQTAAVQDWLEEQLGSKEYFNGDGSAFGYADLCVIPVLHRSVHYGFGPKDGSSLFKWHARVESRKAVAETLAEMEAAAGKMAEIKDAFLNGPNKREYRDHRLEWMIKSGGIDVVTEGLKKGNIRFTWPDNGAA